MSSIFGIFHRDGRPVDTSGLHTLQSGMARWGFDGAGVWCEGPCGLGQLLQHETPEAAHEQLPVWIPERQVAFTAKRDSTRATSFASVWRSRR